MRSALTLITKNIEGIGSFGALYYNGMRFAVSVERDWVNNEKSISCIPAGTYKLVEHHSGKFGRVYALENKNVGVSLCSATQRTYIYIHPANVPNELEGCIAFGTCFNPNTWGVLNSRQAVEAVYDLIDNDDIKQITIVRH